MNMNMQQLMKQAKQLQDQLQKKQEELEHQTFEASSGGGMVTAVVTGKQELITLTIDPSIVTTEDVDMLQDLVVAAVNEAIRKTKEAASGLLGGMLGGMPGFPGA